MTMNTNMPRRSGITRRALASASTGVVALAAAGCGSGSGRETGVPVRTPVTQGVVIRYGSKDTAAAIANLQVLAKEEFETAFPGARIEIEIPTGNYFDKLQTQLAAGTEPDTQRFDDYYIAYLVGKGAIQPLDAYASRDKRFDTRGLYPIPYRAGHYQSKFYGLTTGPNTYIIVYNRSAFDEAGLKPPPSDYRDKTWTWNRMREDARKLLRLGATPQDIRFGFMWDVSLFSRFSALVRANAGKIVDRDEDPKKGALDDPKTLELFGLFQEMRHRDRTVPTDDELKAPNPPSVFNGRLAMQASLANVGSNFKDAPFKWDFAPLPRANGSGQASTTLISNVYGMLKSTKHPELAWAWVRIMGSARQGLFQVRQNDFMPGWKSLRDEYVKLPPEHRSVALDTAEYGLPSITTPKYVEMQDLVLQGLAPIWAGTAPVKQTVDQLLPKLNDLLR